MAGARKCVAPWVGSGTDSTYHCGNSFNETPLLKGPVPTDNCGPARRASSGFLWARANSAIYHLPIHNKRRLGTILVPGESSVWSICPPSPKKRGGEAESWSCGNRPPQQRQSSCVTRRTARRPGDKSSAETYHPSPPSPQPVNSNYL